MNLSVNLHPADSIIVAAYLLAVLSFGLWVGRNQRDPSDYFLGNRAVPWGALLLSIVATETSTVTFLSIPGIAAASGGNLTFLQLPIGYIVGRLFVVRYLLPLYFKGKPFTAYEVLQSRFGKLSRRMASSLFLVTRNVADALRLYLTALVLQIVLGLDLSASVVIIGLVTMLYTFVGGAKSVIWNDSVQFAVYLCGALAAGSIIVRALPGGLGQILQFADEGHKLRVFDFATGLSHPSMTFWAGLAGGAFLTAATHGTDQLMVQRYLAAKNQASAACALGLSGFVVLLQFALFLLIGVGLAALFASDGAAAGLSAGSNDRLFAWFIVNYMPVGLVGITLAAVFAAAMSTLSSSLNSSAAALVNDLYVPLCRHAPDPRAQLQAGRIATVSFGLLQIGIAVLFGLIGTDESTVANVLKISGFATGPVLGLYFLVVFVPAVRQTAALAGFGAGVLVLSAVALGTAVYWPWYALVGSLTTLGSGALVQVLKPGTAAAE